MTLNDELQQSLALGLLLGQRRAFAAVGGRCSAAHAQLLRRIHDQKLYLPLAASWEEFCGERLAISRRHADRIIALLNRFGPVYFEVSELIGLSPREYLEIEPAIREHCVVVNGESVSLIPENSPQIAESLTLLLDQTRKAARRSPTPEALCTRGRNLAARFVALYHSCHSQSGRRLILETAAEIREILAGLLPPHAPRTDNEVLPQLASPHESDIAPPARFRNPS